VCVGCSWRGVGGCAAAAQIKWQIMPKEARVTVVARLCQWVPWGPRAEVDGGARGCCARATKTQPTSNRNLEIWAEVWGHHHAIMGQMMKWSGKISDASVKKSCRNHKTVALYQCASQERQFGAFVTAVGSNGFVWRE
jgi:hypothetical protein